MIKILTIRDDDDESRVPFYSKSHVVFPDLSRSSLYRFIITSDYFRVRFKKYNVT